MPSDVANIIIEILPIEQSHLQIELKVCEELLNSFNNSITLKNNEYIGKPELNISSFINHLTQKISKLKIELKKYESKQYTITAPTSTPTKTESINEQ